MGVTSGPGASGALDNGNKVDNSKASSDKGLKNGHDKENKSSNGSVIKSGGDGDANDVVTSTDTIEIGANINVSYQTFRQ